jgi:hypothetical protein
MFFLHSPINRARFPRLSWAGRLSKQLDDESRQAEFNGIQLDAWADWDTPVILAFGNLKIHSLDEEPHLPKPRMPFQRRKR